MKTTILVVLLAAAVLAGADSGEFLLDLEVAYTRAEYEQLYPAAASDGTNSLVVWGDGRSGLPDICGARLTPDGTVLDPAGIVISGAANGQTRPAVACDGTNYLVVWADQRGDTSDVYATRVTPAGCVLDPAGIAVSAAAGFQGEPAVTFDGTDYLVVWTDLRNGESDIYGARVTRDGMLVDTTGLALVAIAGEQTAPAVVYDGTNVLLVWGDTRNDILGDVYGARVTAGGTVLDSAGFVVSAASNWQGSPGIAVSRNEGLVVWHDMRVGTDVDVYGARITSAGEVLDPSGIAISTLTNNQWFPKVAFDGTSYLVVWVDAAGHGNIFGGRVGTDGAVLDPQGFLISFDGEYEASPAVTFDGSHNAVVWYDLRAGAVGLDIYAARVDGAGVVLDPQSIPVSTAAIPQRRPKAAFDGTAFLVVWDEARDFGRDIRGVRLTPQGAVLDSPGIRISPPGRDQSYPAVAHGASDFLVVWEDGRSRDLDVRGARVSPAGVVLDSTSILIAGRGWEQCAPAAASDGNDFLVVWQDWRNGSYAIFGARVSHSGTLLDTSGIAVCTSAGWQTAPEVTCNGTNYLVAWQNQTTGACDLYGARVSRAGIVLDPNGFVVSAATGVQQQPAVAAAGQDFVVAWSDGRNGNRDIYGARVTDAGAVLDTAGICICSAPGTQDYPAIEYDGTNYLVVWQDERDEEQDICGARVTPQGSILDTFPVTTEQGDQSDPALARGQESGMLMVLSGWTGIVEDEPYNSFRIWGTLSPFVGMEEGLTATVPASQPTATLVRNRLFLPISLSPPIPVSLLDISGRNVADLSPGVNDVSRLAPGIYFVRYAVNHQQSRTTKVVVTR